MHLNVLHIFAYDVSMFPTPSDRKTFVVTCKRCGRDMPSGREEFPFQSVAVGCPLCGELRRYALNNDKWYEILDSSVNIANIIARGPGPISAGHVRARRKHPHRVFSAWTMPRWRRGKRLMQGRLEETRRIEPRHASAHPFRSRHDGVRL